MPEDIGGVSISITGDYSQLERDFDAATAAATQAGNEIASAFTGAVTGTEKLTAATGDTAAAFNVAENASKELSSALTAATSQTADFETRIQALVDSGMTLAQAMEVDSAALQATAQASDTLKTAVDDLSNQFAAARGPIDQMGAAAQELVATQGRLDQELTTAKQALSEIRTAYEQGGVSASTLARAEAEVERATAAANIPLKEVPAALAHFSDAARDLIQEQAKLDQELATAKKALEEIKGAYEQGAVGANVLARAQEEVDKAAAKTGQVLHEHGSAIDTVKEKLEGFASALKGDVSGALEGFGLSSSEVGVALIGLAGIVAIAYEAFEKLFEVGEAFEGASHQIISSTGAMGEELERLEGAFRQVFVAANESAAEVAGALSILEARLHPTTGALVDLTKTLLDLHDITKEAINPLVRATAELFQTWRIATNEQIDALNDLKNAAMAANIPVTDMERSLVKFGPTFRELHLGLTESAELFAALELKTGNADRAMTGIQAALRKLAKEGFPDVAEGLVGLQEKIKGATTETEALAAANEFFKRQGPLMADLLRSGALDFRHFGESIQFSTEKIEDQVKRVEDFQMVWGNLKNQILNDLAPLGLAVAKLATELLKSTEDDIHLLERAWFRAHGIFLGVIGDVEAGKKEYAKAGQQAKETGDQFHEAFKNLPKDVQDAVLRTSALAGGIKETGAEARAAAKDFDAWLDTLKKEKKGPKEKLPRQGPEPPEGLEEINRQLLEFSKEAPRLAEKAATLTNKALSALGAPIILVDLQKAGEAIKELTDITPAVALMTEEELKLANAMRGLGLSASSTSGRIAKESIQNFEAVAKSGVSSLEDVDAAWARVGQTVEKLWKYNLPEAIRLEKEHLEALKAKHAPLGQIYDSQERILQGQIRYAAQFGRDASEQIIQLTNIRLKHEALADSVNSLGRIYAGLAKTFHDAFDKMSRAIADNIVEGKNWGEVFTGVVKEIEKEILNVLIGEVFKKLRSMIIGTGDDLTAMGKVADGVLGKLGGIFGGSKGGGGGLPGIDTPDSWGVGGGSGGAGSGGGGWGLPGVDGQPGIDMGDDFPGGGGGGGIGGTVGTIAGSAITGVVGAVAGVASAISSVVGNFQMAHMNTALGRIEESTRKTWIVTGEQPDSILWSSKETALWSDRIHGQLDTIRQNTWAMLMDLDKFLGAMNIALPESKENPVSEKSAFEERPQTIGPAVDASSSIQALLAAIEKNTAGALLDLNEIVRTGGGLGGGGGAGAGAGGGIGGAGGAVPPGGGTIRLPGTPEPTPLNPNAISGPPPINILLPPFPQLNEPPAAPPEIAGLLTPEQIDRLGIGKPDIYGLLTEQQKVAMGIEKIYGLLNAEQQANLGIGLPAQLNEPPPAPPNPYGLLTPQDLDRLELLKPPELIEPPSTPPEIGTPPEAPPIYGLLTPADLERLGITGEQLGEPPEAPPIQGLLTAEQIDRLGIGKPDIYGLLTEQQKVALGIEKIYGLLSQEQQQNLGIGFPAQLNEPPEPPAELGEPPTEPPIYGLLTPEQIDKLNIGIEKLNEPPQPPPNIYGMLTADDLDRLSLFQPQLIEPPSAPEELNEPPQAPPIYGLLTPADLERLGIKEPELGEPPAEPMYEVPPATFIPDAIDTVGTEITDSLDVIPEAIGNLGRDISARLETIPRELTSINQEVSSDLSSLAQAVSAKPPMVVRLEQTPTVVAIPGKTPEPHPVSVPTGVPSETTPAAVDLSKGLPERLEDIATILRGIADQLTGIGASLVTGFKEITDKTEGLGERILTGLASGVMGAINAARTAGAAKPSGAGAGDVIGDVVGETISGVVGAVAGVASAISSVIGNFQMAHMNTALGRIEESTRKSWIITGEQADSVWWSTKATALNTDAALGQLDTIRQNTWAILMDLDRMASLSSLSMNVNTSAMSVPVLPFIEGEATSIVSGDTTINAPITVNGAIDPRETAKQVAEHLKLVSSKMAFGSA